MDTPAAIGGFGQLWSQGDAVTRIVAAALLCMSLAAWVLIFWKAWTLRRARKGLPAAIAEFWAASDLDAGTTRVREIDAELVLLPLIDAARRSAPPGTLEAAGEAESQLTRRLRDALHEVLARLGFGQVLLASVGSTAPFVGLFGTVWGIYHALTGIDAAGSYGIDKVAGPVGEALIMTAAGLAVAIPAVLAYNLFGKWVGACEADLEGFAHDLRELLAGPATGAAARAGERDA